MLYSLYTCTFLLFFQLDDSGSPTDELDPIVKIVLNELGSKASTGKEKHFTEQVLALLSKEASLSSFGFFFSVTEVIGDLLVADHIQKCLDEVNEKAVNRASKVKVG